MIHPIIKLIATEPGLLLAHAGGYGQLLVSELAVGLNSLQRRIVLLAVAATTAVCALIFLGVAAILVAAVSIETMPYPGLLLVLPGGLALVSGLCWLFATRQSMSFEFNALRKQAALDVALIRESSEV
jgi:hypothetical protein